MDNSTIIGHFSKVVWVSDDADADRIKARIAPEDDSKDFEDIPYAFPAIPKMFRVKPKVGEMVLIFTTKANDTSSQRVYFGPIISQPHKIHKDPYFLGADSFMRGAFKKFDTAPSMIGDGRFALPSEDDVVVSGRRNCDIILKEDDIRIRAGVKMINDKNEISFNRKNPAYIKLKYHTQELDNGVTSTATIVADRINLLGNSSPKNFDTTNYEDLISDAELKKVIDSAYRLPYGEKLVDFLNVFVNAFVNHTHNFAMLPPNPAHTEQLLSAKATELDGKKMLSNNVRIN